MTMQPRYRIFDHTADVGLEAWGRTPAEAFAAAARGMFAIILGVDPEQWSGVGQARTLAIDVVGADWPELLVNWLVELLFHFEVDGVVPLHLVLRECEPPRCAASVDGRAVAGDDVDGVGIKAVTYHDLRVEVSLGHADVHVIFDI